MTTTNPDTHDPGVFNAREDNTRNVIMKHTHTFELRSELQLKKQTRCKPERPKKHNLSESWMTVIPIQTRKKNEKLTRHEPEKKRSKQRKKRTRTLVDASGEQKTPSLSDKNGEQKKPSLTDKNGEQNCHH